MPNISCVTERIWTGGDLPAERGEDALRGELEAIVARGISHVVDCRMEWSDERFFATHAPDVGYLHHPQDDAGQLIPDAWWEEGTAWARQALEDASAQVLLHCHMGINRGPSLTYALLLTLGIGRVEGLDLVRGARPIAAMDYAEQACDWWLRRTGGDDTTRAAAQRDIARWREHNPLDVVRVIRTAQLDRGA